MIQTLLNKLFPKKINPEEDLLNYINEDKFYGEEDFLETEFIKISEDLQDFYVLRVLVTYQNDFYELFTHNFIQLVKRIPDSLSRTGLKNIAQTTSQAIGIYNSLIPNGLSGFEIESDLDENIREKFYKQISEIQLTEEEILLLNKNYNSLVTELSKKYLEQ